MKAGSGVAMPTRSPAEARKAPRVRLCPSWVLQGTVPGAERLVPAEWEPPVPVLRGASCLVSDGQTVRGSSE